MNDRPRNRALGEVVRYAGVAGFSFCWILGVSAGLHELGGAGERLAVAVAMATALVINFTLLRLLVWPGQSRGIARQFAATAATSVSFRLLEYGLFLLLSGAFGLQYLLATAIAICVSSVGKFLFYREVVFRRPGPPEAEASGAAALSASASGAKPPGS